MQAFETKDLSHLGMVASMFDELGIGQGIDELIKQDSEQRIVSIGQAVKAMVLNGLGFTSQSLYLTPDFFENKPTDRLLGKGIKASHLNDDTLGRALDSLYDHDVTGLFSKLSSKVAVKLGLGSQFKHLDSTSFHLDGQYDHKEEAGVINITKGYSRDHRPDLNQAILNLIVDNQSGIPILMQPASGNSSDKNEFAKIIQTYIGQLKNQPDDSYFVADSALYSEKNLTSLTGIKWITRVPETMTLVKQSIENTQMDKLKPLRDHYGYRSITTTYADQTQRSLVIHSTYAQERAIQSVNKLILKGSEQECKALENLSRQKFACEEDANQALKKFKKTLKHTHIQHEAIGTGRKYKGVGRPKKDDKGEIYFYFDISLVINLEHREKLIHQKSFFILASNELDSTKLSDSELFDAYKDQQKVERGFRFLKDPWFMTSSFFLKSPKRIMALLFVMTICLTVYAALEYRIRHALANSDKTFPDQKGKPIKNPTARWVFQKFTGVHVLTIENDNQLIINLKNHHLTLIKLLGEAYEAVYS